jgi:hypothetical protein
MILTQDRCAMILARFEPNYYGGGNMEPRVLNPKHKKPEP